MYTSPKFFITAFLFFISLASGAQAFQKAYQKGAYYSIHRLPSGHFVVAGTPIGTNNDSRLLVHKLKPDGSLLDSRTVTAKGGISFDATHPPHIILQDGDSLLFSFYASSIFGNTSIYPGLSKMDTSFNAAWWKSYTNVAGNLGNPRGGISQSFKAADGNYVHAGWFNAAQGNTFNYFPMIQKTDVYGNEIWKYNVSPLTFEFMYAACEAVNGNYIIAGGTSRARVIATNTSGAYQWYYSYNINGNNASEATDILPLADGGFLVTGSVTRNGVSDKDGYLLKLNSNGTMQWCRTYGGTGNDYFYKSKPTADGGFIVCGKTESYGAGLGDGWLTKVNATGVVQWSSVYGVSTEESLNDVIQLSNGDFVSVGSSASEAWIIRANQNGITGCHEAVVAPVVSDVTPGTTQSTMALAFTNYAGVSPQLVKDTVYTTSANNYTLLNQHICAGNVFSFGGATLNVSGTYSSTLPGRVTCDSLVELQLTVHPVGNIFTENICQGDVYVFQGQSLTTTGLYSTDTTTSVYGCDSALVLNLVVHQLPVPVVAQNGATLSTGVFTTYQWYLNNTVIPGATAQNYIPSQNGNYYVIVTNAAGCSDTSAIYNLMDVGITENSIFQNLSIYPNPASQELNIVFTQTGTYKLTDLTGREVRAECLSASGNTTIDLSGMDAGVYMLTVTASGNQTTIRKIIKN